MTQSFQDYPWGTQGFPDGLVVKNLSAMQEVQDMQVQSLGQEDPLEEATATHSSLLTWRIPWTEEPDRLHSPWDCSELDMTKAT